MTPILDFTRDFLIMQLLLLCIILLNQDQDSLNYYNGYSNASKDPSYIVSRGRRRNLCELDELFLTLTRLRLGLLEKDLSDRFNILQQDVSQIFATCIDRLSYCLGQLSFKTDRESTALSQTMRMFIL